MATGRSLDRVDDAGGAAVEDPAWFYSTLAQVSAAIVALIAAVIGSRIIDQYVSMRAERNELDLRIQRVHHRISFHADYLPKFRNYVLSEIDADDNLIRGGATEREVPPRTDLRWTGRVEIPQAGRLALPDHLQAMRRTLRDLDKVIGSYRIMAGKIREADAILYAGELRARAAELSGEGQAVVLSDADQLDALTQRITTFHARLLPWQFLLVIPLLGVLTVSGIIWPLTVLPTLPISTHRLGLWISVAVGLGGLVLYLLGLGIALLSIGYLQWPRRIGHLK